MPLMRTSPLLLVLYSLPDALCQLFGVQRLDETAIHTDPMAGLGALVGGLCRHGEDGNGGGVGPVEGADGPASLPFHALSTAAP